VLSPGFSNLGGGGEEQVGDRGDYKMIEWPPQNPFWFLASLSLHLLDTAAAIIIITSLNRTIPKGTKQHLE
jgi:hypothetical protein